MYTGVLYGILGLLVAFSLLLYLLVKILSAHGRELTREKMRGDIERLDNLPSPIKMQPVNSPGKLPETEADNNFIPSTLKIN